MKKNDITLVVACIVVGGAFSLVVSNLLINPSTKKEKVEVVEKISSEFPEANKKYFNADSINPTQVIQIGNGSIDQAR